MITNRTLSKTLLRLITLSVLIALINAESSLVDDKPLIQITQVADETTNEIEDSSRAGRNLNISSDDKSPNSVFDDLYNKCLANLSFPCLQRKMLVYMNKVDRIKGVNLIGSVVSVVRTSEDQTPEMTEDDLEKKLSPAEEESQLENLMEHQVDKFMDNHVIRLKLPEGITAGLTNSLKGRSYSIAGNALDISLARMFTIVEEGRKKKGGGGGGKKMKKMMGMMMMGMMGKMAMLIPLGMMLIKVKAVKALIIAKLALALSLIQIFKKLMSGKGGSSGGGKETKEVIIVHDNHGDSGSSGGGWSSGGGGGGWSSGGSSGGHSSGGGGGWSSGGGGHGGDSYSSGHHQGGGDATYGGGGGDAGGWSSGGGGGGWGKRSWDPETKVTHTTWPMYRAYANAASNTEDEK